MNGIVVGGGRGEQRPLRRLMRTTRVAGVRSRTLIVLHAAEEGHGADRRRGRLPSPTVLKVLHRVRAAGEGGLRNHRADDGHAKVDDGLRAGLATLLVGSPEDYGCGRPTWTQELLARPSGYETRVRVSDSTGGRMVANLGAPWAWPAPRWPARGGSSPAAAPETRARPRVRCPLDQAWVGGHTLRRCDPDVPRRAECAVRSRARR
jgi:hypothetical protein